ncbi:NADPH-dependent FMN reductase [Sphingomonas sp. Root710]|uniref:NADPH-dependent FMN reductase n=1 Tax=Sphingomonas sp. Root710 TaxID=1736594 RepID=UPI000AD77BA5|nr:NAD(P)H-dependent oxidoreductase [Sphingomonas sp. Root710]
MEKPRIAIIISTTREGRFGPSAAAWIEGLAAQRDDMDFAIVDLRDYDLPLFDSRTSPMRAPVTNPVALAWQEAIAGFDGYLFVTAEYNRSITGALKNALDWTGPQLARKPAAYLGYGSLGAARAVEHLRQMCVELQMAPMRFGVHIAGADANQLLIQRKPFSEVPLPHLEAGAKELFDELSWWTRALKVARAA